MGKPERTGTEHVLHFGDLSPRDFERLCLWLLRAEGYEDVDHVGASGSDGGCDLSATKNGLRLVCQCKRVTRFGPKAAEKEIDKIVDWPEDDWPDEILFLVTCDISTATRKRASEKAASMGCTFWPLTVLDQRVKGHEDILAEFFKEHQSVINNQTNIKDDQYNAQGDITVVRGDQIQGDKIAGDIIEGDKVLGDKIVITPPPPPYLNQIPEPVADFVGREGEIETLLAAFDGAGRGAVISGVQGMGGAGKTELGKVLAKRLKERFPDAQIYFNLHGASDDDSIKPATAAEVLSHVIRSFHPGTKLPEDVDSLQGIYHSVLEGKRVLLLMDNARDAGQLRMSRGGERRAVAELGANSKVVEIHADTRWRAAGEKKQAEHDRHEVSDASKSPHVSFLGWAQERLLRPRLYHCRGGTLLLVNAHPRKRVSHPPR